MDFERSGRSVSEGIMAHAPLASMCRRGEGFLLYEVLEATKKKFPNYTRAWDLLAGKLQHLAAPTSVDKMLDLIDQIIGKFVHQLENKCDENTLNWLGLPAIRQETDGLLEVSDLEASGTISEPCEIEQMMRYEFLPLMSLISLELNVPCCCPRCFARHKVSDVAVDKFRQTVVSVDENPQMNESGRPPFRKRRLRPKLHESEAPIQSNSKRYRSAGLEKSSSPLESCMIKDFPFIARTASEGTCIMPVVDDDVEMDIGMTYVGFGVPNHNTNEKYDVVLSSAQHFLTQLYKWRDHVAAIRISSVKYDQIIKKRIQDIAGPGGCLLGPAMMDMASSLSACRENPTDAAVIDTEFYIPHPEIVQRMFFSTRSSKYVVHKVVAVSQTLSTRSAWSASNCLKSFYLKVLLSDGYQMEFRLKSVDQRGLQKRRRMETQMTQISSSLNYFMSRFKATRQRCLHLVVPYRLSISDKLQIVETPSDLISLLDIWDANCGYKSPDSPIRTAALENFGRMLKHKMRSERVENKENGENGKMVPGRGSSGDEANHETHKASEAMKGMDVCGDSKKEKKKSFGISNFRSSHIGEGEHKSEATSGLSEEESDIKLEVYKNMCKSVSDSILRKYITDLLSNVESYFLLAKNLSSSLGLIATLSHSLQCADWHPSNLFLSLNSGTLVHFNMRPSTRLLDPTAFNSTSQNLYEEAGRRTKNGRGGRGNATPLIRLTRNILAVAGPFGVMGRLPAVMESAASCVVSNVKHQLCMRSLMELLLFIQSSGAAEISETSDKNSVVVRSQRGAGSDGCFYEVHRANTTALMNAFEFVGVSDENVSVTSLVL